MTRWEGESSESAYEGSSMGACASGVKCGVVEWFGYTEMMKSEEFVRKVYVSEIEGPSRRGRPLGRIG